jgi:hypothetical protein
MSIATTADLEITQADPLLKPLACAAGCVALADWLFWNWWAWRRQRYFATYPPAWMNPDNSDKG